MGIGQLEKVQDVDNGGANTVWVGKEQSVPYNSTNCNSNIKDMYWCTTVKSELSELIGKLSEKHSCAIGTTLQRATSREWRSNSEAK
jgi:hypothetical protein